MGNDTDKMKTEMMGGFLVTYNSRNNEIANIKDPYKDLIIENDENFNKFYTLEPDTILKQLNKLPHKTLLRCSPDQLAIVVNYNKENVKIAEEIVKKFPFLDNVKSIFPEINMIRHTLSWGGVIEQSVENTNKKLEHHQCLTIGFKQLEKCGICGEGYLVYTYDNYEVEFDLHILQEQEHCTFCGTGFVTPEMAARNNLLKQRMMKILKKDEIV